MAEDNSFLDELDVVIKEVERAESRGKLDSLIKRSKLVKRVQIFYAYEHIHPEDTKGILRMSQKIIMDFRVSVFQEECLRMLEYIPCTNGVFKLHEILSNELTKNLSSQIKSNLTQVNAQIQQINVPQNNANFQQPPQQPARRTNWKKIMTTTNFGCIYAFTFAVVLMDLSPWAKAISIFVYTLGLALISVYVED